jgi:hypothetical protein
MIKHALKSTAFKLTVLFLALSWPVATAQNIPSPKEHFGFDIGDDYQLATFTQTEAYFKKLAATSDRVKFTVIGQTEEGRSQPMLIISAPANLKKLDHYKEISRKLARAEDLSPTEAKALAAEGKAVVWIDGGLHATETVGIHQLIQTAWKLSTATDAETLRILDDVIILVTHANPDGQELVSNWYMRHKDPKDRTLSGLPRLYQKYVGHDNNRDFFMLNMKEAQNIGRQLFVEWIPQIMYNHHQSGPAGTIVAGAPYRDPHNYVFDPLLMTTLDALGAAMHNRLNAEDKPGYTQRNGSVFSTWYNGGLRTTTYFHNMIGLLTEIVGSPTPSVIPLVPERLLPNGDSPNPAAPQKWHFRQSIDYSVSLNYAVLNYAQRYRDELLYNIYLMGKNSIERGSKDTWLFAPKKLSAIKDTITLEQKGAKLLSGSTPRTAASYYNSVMKNPALRDARGYIVPKNQPDFTTAVRFINALIKTGIQVQKASADFTVAGKAYPKGSFIVKTNQAFRPHVLDMFEPQDHPNDFKYEGGPPIAPYDAAGWTPAYLMNVKFDRLVEDFKGPFERLPYGAEQKADPYMLPAAKGYLLSARSNDSYLLVNDLLKNSLTVSRSMVNGDFYIAHSLKAKSLIDGAIRSAGIFVQPAVDKPSSFRKICTSRTALFDSYGGSMASGWVRWIMEQYHFGATVVYPQDIDKGNLNDQYDVLIFMGGGIPEYRSNFTAGSSRLSSTDPKDIPKEYRNRVGKISQDKSIPQLRKFMEAGGRIVTVGSSTNLAEHLGLSVKDALVEVSAEGKEKSLSREKYYVPGSVLRVDLDTTVSANWGMDKLSDVYFNNSPVFKVDKEAVLSGAVKPLAWFGTDAPLRSGWAWGQAYLKDGVAAFEAKIGKGGLYAFGPEITFRAQSHGTFKLLFNQLYQLKM